MALATAAFLLLKHGAQILTLFAYLALMLSSMATMLCLEKSSGEICTRSENLVCDSAH
jgi:hypothetical protein